MSDKLTEIRERWSKVRYECGHADENTYADDVGYLLSLLQQPASERCGECGLEGCSIDGICACGGKTDPATGADEGGPERCRLCGAEFAEDAPLGSRCGCATPPANVAEGEAQRVSPKANVEWLKANADNYVGQWVALKNGELLDFDRTPEALRERLGPTKGTGILVTLAKWAPNTTTTSDESAIEAARAMFVQWQEDTGLGKWLNPDFGGWKLLIERIAALIPDAGEVERLKAERNDARANQDR